MADAETPQRELAALREQVAALTAERDAYARHSAQLMILQQVFTAMNSTLDVEDLLAMVLRGVREALGFERVVLFTVEDGRARRHLETSGDAGIVVAADAAAYLPTPALLAIVSGEAEFATGSAGDGASPLPDAEGSYALLPLVSRGRILGVLYADRPTFAFDVELQLQALFDFAAQAAIVVENARLHRELLRALEETQELASTDALTGLVNRRALFEHLDRELHNAERYRAAFAVMMIDMDDLKGINDSGGHAAGDDALRRFAEALKRAARKGDVVARYGGDEFVVVLTQADHRAAGIAAERVHAAIHEESLRASCGVGVFPMDGTTPTTLIEAADRAVYRAKRAGKDRVEFSSIIIR